MNNNTRSVGILAFQLIGSYFGPWGTLIGGMVGAAVFGGPDQKIEGPRLSSDATKIQDIQYGSNINKNFGTIKNSGTLIWATDLQEESSTTYQDSKGDSSIETTSYTYFFNGAILLNDGEIDGIRKFYANEKIVFDLSETNLTNSGCYVEDLYENDLIIGQKITLNSEYSGELYVYNGKQTEPNSYINSINENSPAYSGYSYVFLKKFALKNFNESMPTMNFEIVNSTNKDAIQIVFNSNDYTFTSRTDNIVIVANKIDDYVYILSDDTVAHNSYLLKIDALKNEVVSRFDFNENVGSNNNYLNILDDGNLILNKGLGFCVFDTQNMKIKQTILNSQKFDNYPKSPSIERNGEKMIFNKNNNTYFNVYTYNDSIIVHNYYGLTQANNVLSTSLYDTSSINTNPSFFNQILLSSIPNFSSNHRNGWAGTGGFTKYTFDTANNTIYTYTKENTSSGQIYLSRILNGYSIDYMYVKVINEVTNIDINDIYFDDVSRCIYLKYSNNQNKNFILKYDIDNNVQIANTSINFDDEEEEVSTSIIHVNNARQIFMSNRNISTQLSNVIYYDLDTAQVKKLNENIETNISQNQSIAFNSKLNVEYYLKNIDSFSFRLVKNFGIRFLAKSYNLKKLIEDLSTKVLIKNTNIDATELVNDEVLGYTVNSKSNAKSIIEQLSPIFSFSCIESDYKIKYIKNGKEAVDTIYKKDLGAQNYAENLDFKDLLITDSIDEKQLVKQVNLTYYNIDLNYNNDTQFDSVICNSLNTIDFNIPIVLNEDFAKNTCAKLINESHSKRKFFEFTTNYNYLYLEVLDVIYLNYNDIIYKLKIEQIEKNGGLIKFKCSEENSNVYIQSKTSETSKNQDLQVLETLSNTASIFFDLPALSNKHLEDGGYYLSNKQLNESLSWTGSSTFISDEEQEKFTLLQSFDKQVILGKTLSKLDYLNINFDEFGYYIDNSIDYYNSVIVKIKSGELNSCSIDQLLNTKNLCLINNELIQFLNAELIEENTYILSGLLRGRFNTDEYIKTHNENDDFYMVNLDGSVQNVNDTIDNINKINYYKTLTNKQKLNDVNTQAFYNTAQRLKAYKINNLFIERQANNDFKIEFNKSLRGYHKALQQNEIFDIDNDNYVLEIYGNINYETLIKTYTINSLQYTYTIDQQNIDFNNVLQSNIYAKIYKLNKFGHYGKEYKFVLN